MRRIYTSISFISKQYLDAKQSNKQQNLSSIIKGVIEWTQRLKFFLKLELNFKINTFVQITLN